MAELVRDGVAGGRDRLVDVAVADALLRRRRQAGAEPRRRPRGAARAGRGAARLRPRRHRGGAADRRSARRTTSWRSRSSSPSWRARAARRSSWAPLLPSPFLPRRRSARASTRRRRSRRPACRWCRRSAAGRSSCASTSPMPGFGLDNNRFWRPIMAKPRDERRRLFADRRVPRRAARRSQGPFVAALAPGLGSPGPAAARRRSARRAGRIASVVEIAAERGSDAGRRLLRHRAGRRPGRAVGRARC